MLTRYVEAFIFGGDDIPKGYKLKSGEFKGTHAYVTCEEYTSSNGAVWPRVVEIAPCDPEDEPSPYEDM